MVNQWYKSAVVYGIDVKVFSDSDGDGMGDFQGLISKLDYLSSLGVNCLWLLPFHPSPKIDNGYDVADYYNVDPALGNLGDFVQFIHEADQRGIRVIMDLVINHTSVENSWFKDASATRESRYRDYYIWEDEPKENKEKVMLKGIQESIWEYSEATDSYYLHRYFKDQADLNLANPRVRKEVLKIMDFWLKLGVSGFRIDAAHVVTDPADVDHIDFGNLHTLFDEMRAFLDIRNPNAVLLGEASVGPDELPKYFGNNESGKERIHMLFNFLINKHIMLSFARQEGATVAKGLKLYKDIAQSHWLNFVRHHDELNLELLSDDERMEVWNAFAPEEDMRLFGHGIRRRLPPMLKNNHARIRQIYSLMFSMPGTPLISYGEEIGMGDNLSLEGRESVRTPMQWSPVKGGGFSTADPEDLYRPVIESGDYSTEKINVNDQQNDPSSLLNWFCSLVKVRRQNPVIGMGAWDILNVSDSCAVALIYEMPEATVVVAHNLSPEPVEVSVDTGFLLKSAVEIFSDEKYDKEILFNKLKLNGYGYRWIQVLDKEKITFLNN
ncbi:alpha-amylase family protein [Cytophagaceae bacterium ABcell3]|nr:alpha-amylase family protein [Cytophagaceae bacterium ABcell3]